MNIRPIGLIGLMFLSPLPLASEAVLRYLYRVPASNGSRCVLTIVKQTQTVTRNILDGLPAELFRQGASYAPDLFLYVVNGERIIVKDYRAKGWMLRSLYGRFVIGREARILAALDGVAGVPQFRGRPDKFSVAMTYIPCLPRAEARPIMRANEQFMGELERIVADMQRRGIVHLDLRHRTNVQVSDEGRPVVLDFATGLRFNTKWPHGRLGLAIFGWVDRMALRNWKRSLCPHLLTPAEMRKARVIRVLSKLWLPRHAADAMAAAFGMRKKRRADEKDDVR